ncbi:sulfate adenylyltransferase, partial [bacterium]|nr:sulfate adenylyltransferase [bacterium]
NYQKLVLDIEQVKDVKNLANGVYSPLEGFLKEDDFLSVCKEMRLKNGLLWPIPVVLDITKEEYQRIKNQKDVVLEDQTGKPIALLKNIEIYPYSKEFFAENVFGTRDRNHPGVEEVYRMGDYLVGGDILLLDDSKEPFGDYNFLPKETKEYFQKKGWQTVCAFQTRNVPHRGHEFLQKEALKITDGLFIQPVIGRKKLADFKDEYILVSYEVLIERYYPKNRVLLGILPLKMRYAGPREAVFHALIRKNFGCTHFIVGRDHAGVGNFYKPTAAQEIFDKFDRDEIGIEILKFSEAVYCQSCQKHVFVNQCSHPEEVKVHFSGTEIRERIKKGEVPPFYLMRPEVYHLVSGGLNSLVDDFYRGENLKPGFCLWLTGLSQAGKTTIADRLYNILKEKGLKVERLDGDIVRQSLTKDLGFTKEDRNENLRRVGSLARLFVQRGVIVIASFISPYKKIRQELRERIPNFIEVFVNCPLEVCEKRDVKGLYQKARRGEIKNFTGVSDPYELPENSEIELKTDKESVEQSVEKIVNYLKNKKLINL